MSEKLPANNKNNNEQRSEDISTEYEGESLDKEERDSDETRLKREIERLDKTYLDQGEYLSEEEQNKLIELKKDLYNKNKSKNNKSSEDRSGGGEEKLNEVETEEQKYQRENKELKELKEERSAQGRSFPEEKQNRLNELEDAVYKYEEMRKKKNETEGKEKSGSEEVVQETAGESGEEKRSFEKILEEKRKEFAKMDLKQVNKEDLSEEYVQKKQEYIEALKNRRKERIESLNQSLSKEDRSKEIERIMTETLTLEAINLHEAKLEATLNEKPDALKEKAKNIGKIVVGGYRKLPLRYKLAFSAGLLGLGAGAGALGGTAGAALATGAIAGSWAQRGLSGLATTVGLEGLLEKRKEKKTEKEVLELFAEGLEEKLNSGNAELDEKLFELEKRKKGERHRRYIAAGAAGFLVGSGAVGKVIGAIGLIDSGEVPTTDKGTETAETQYDNEVHSSVGFPDSFEQNRTEGVDSLATAESPGAEPEPEAESSYQETTVTPEMRQEFYSKFIERFGAESSYGKTMDQVSKSLLDGRVTPEEYQNFFEKDVLQGDEMPFDEERHIRHLNYCIEKYNATDNHYSKRAAETLLTSIIDRDISFIGNVETMNELDPEGAEVPKEGVVNESQFEKHRFDVQEFDEQPEWIKNPEMATAGSSGIEFGVEIKPGESVWSTTESFLKDNLGDKFENLNEAQKTHLIDQIKDKIAEDPSKFGMEGVDSIDMVQAGQKIDLSPLAKDGLIGSMLESSNDLSQEAMENIVRNDEIIEEWVKENPGERLTSEKVDSILYEKGIAEEQMVKESSAETKFSPIEEVEEETDPSKHQDVPVDSEETSDSEPPEQSGAEKGPVDEEFVRKEGSGFEFEEFGFEYDTEGNVSDMHYKGNVKHFDPNKFIDLEAANEDPARYQEKKGEIKSSLGDIKIHEQVLREMEDKDKLGSKEYDWVKNRLQEKIALLKEDHGNIFEEEKLNELAK